VVVFLPEPNGREGKIHGADFERGSRTLITDAMAGRAAEAIRTDQFPADLGECGIDHDFRRAARLEAVDARQPFGHCFRIGGKSWHTRP